MIIAKRNANAGEPVRSRAVLPRSVWSSEVVEARLAAAADTLHVFRADWPSDKVVAWPDVVRSYWDAFGREPTRVSRPRPTPKQIDDCDEALAWLLLVDDQADAQLLWARAMGVRWRPLVQRLRRSERTLRDRHKGLLRFIAFTLNA